MWKPRRLTNLLAFTACYRDTFTFFALLVWLLVVTNDGFDTENIKELEILLFRMFSFKATWINVLYHGEKVLGHIRYDYIFSFDY
jgi:hypothetical protein